MNNKEKESEEDKDFPFEIEPVLNYIGPKARWQYFQSFCLRQAKVSSKVYKTFR